MGIRDILKSIFPLPAKKQRQEFATIKAKLKGQETLISKREDEIELLLEALIKSQDENKHQSDVLEHALNQLQDIIKKQEQTLGKQGQALEKQEQALEKQGQALEKQEQALEKQGQILETQGQTLKKQGQILETQGQALEKQEQTLGKQNVEIKQHEESFSKGLTQIQGCLRRVDANIVPKVLWSSKFERNIVKLNWGDVTAQEDFAEKFIKLTKGMDAKSVQAIIRILSRQKAYLNSDKDALDLFTRSEQEEIRLLKENFYSEILKLSDNLFAYRNYLLPVKHFESSVFYYKHGLEEMETADSVAGKTIIDVGGFIGDSVLIFEELDPGKIYTFEALPENFDLLKQTLKLNDIKNVIAENVALGAEKGECTLHMAESGSTAINRPGLNYTGDINVPVITLDDYVSEHKIENIGLIKVDIEGGEPAFLVGAKHTICTQKPILLLSIYHNAHDFFELKPLLESWNLGYKFKIHKPTFENATSETLLIAEIV